MRQIQRISMLALGALGLVANNGVTVTAATPRRTTTSSTSSSSRTSSQQRSEKEESLKAKTKSLYLKPSEVTEMAGARDDQWSSLGEEVEFLPSQKMVMGGPDSNAHLMDDAQLRKWAAGQLEANQEQQDAMRAAGSGRPTSKAIQVERKKQQHQQDQTNNRNLASSTSSNSNAYRLSPFVEGETEYDEYQTAWRMLGFMIDCDDDVTDWMTDDWYNQNNENRGSGDDEGTGEGCHRYVLWAAYVDLDYQGGGIGEYTYWDKNNNNWNDIACDVAGENGEGSRCAKMDCHLDDTHWSLLGMFKHRSLDDWMEQLFKHEGMCVWTDDEYDFMSDAREAWPSGCIDSGTYTESGDPVYYGTKPLAGAKLTIGLYTDTRCVEEYVPLGSDDPITVENVVGNLLAEGGSGDNNNNNDDDGEASTYEYMLDMWDEALETFRTCQPCVAYDVNNYGYNFDDDANRGSTYGTYRYGYDDDYRYNYYYGDGNEQGNDFDCYDDADYTNVNQCMKFMAKTEMNTASFRDLLLADSQGTILTNPLNGYMNSKNEGWIQRRRNSTSAFGMWFWFICSTVLLGYGYISFSKVQKHTNYRLPKFQMNMKQPLVFT